MSIPNRPPTSLDPSLTGILDLCARLFETRSQSEHLDVLVEGAIEILRVDSGYLVQQRGDRLIFFRRWNSPVGKAEPVSRAIVADALKSPHALLVSNASLDARYSLRESVRSNTLRSVLAARINTDEPVALYLESSTRQLDDQHLELFQRIVDLSASTLERSALELQQSASQRLFERYDFSGIVARDPETQKTLDLVARVAVADYTVLIQGPSGVGKELIARAIHRNSKRRDQPLVVINCGAISASLLESELFGHVAGAFTGASHDNPGLVQSAQGGTLLLDEVGDLPPELQVKLLRTLQSGEIQPVGAAETRQVDVRFLASTHRDLEQEVANGSFRHDLHQRLNTLVVKVPPLAERPGDILPLFRHFLSHAAADMEVEPPEVAEDAEHKLLRYSWPGNVRELENEAKRLVVLGASDTITAERLSFSEQEPTTSITDSGSVVFAPPGTLEDQERETIRYHLDQANGNRSQAARTLGISREGLRKKLIRFGMQ